VELDALGMAQHTFMLAARSGNEGVDAFATGSQILLEICGDIRSEAKMKQQLVQGMRDYLRKDAFVLITAQGSHQQVVIYVTGKHRSAKDVMALASRGRDGTSSRRGDPSRSSSGLAAPLLAPPVVTDVDQPMAVSGIPFGVPDGRGQARPADPRQQARTRRRCATCKQVN